jgi:hypothetical protein
MTRNLYKTPFPEKNFEDTVMNVLRLTPKQYEQFQGVARHYLGEQTFHEALPRYPKHQLLRSSLETVRDTAHPSTLASLLHVEDFAHHSREHDFNRGGGLLETANSLFSGLWNMIGLGPELDSFYDWMGWNPPKIKVTELDHQFAEIVQQSYNNKRAPEIGDWERVVDLDTGKFTTWQDESNQNVHVALKGTTGFSDVLNDLAILVTNRTVNEGEIRKYLTDVAERFPDSKLTASAHSLGSNQLLNVFANPDDTLDRYSRVNLFAPGVTPTHNLINARYVAQHPERFYLYLNTGDMVSNTFVSLIPSNRENTYFSKPHHSPSYNHSLGQWIETV